MRISTKGRYGLAVMVALAQKKINSSVSDIANHLGLSKIYLEQVFTLLKRANLIVSQKGSGGGYSLAESPKNISAYAILLATESALFESAELNPISTTESALHAKVWQPMDTLLQDFLSDITLESLIEQNAADMFYI